MLKKLDVQKEAAVTQADVLNLRTNKAFYLSSFALFLLWVVFCWRGLASALEIWYGNEIFNHCFFVVPGALYLIYTNRSALLAQPFKTSYLAFIVIFPAILLYVVGIAGDIQLFLHAATFTLLPALIWFVIGNGAAKTILFPLCFMLFSIPVGEQLIPYFQEIAADGSVWLLRLTDVPLFRSGLYIEIPQGRFLVAEACSGVSFFVASFVIGTLYAYLNLRSAPRKLLFVGISLCFPILANIVRVYGIILIAYWTDMEHAAGADHLIYGWFFFAFVLVCLLGIGELVRDRFIEPEEAADNTSMQSPRVSALSVSLCCALLTAGYLMYNAIWHADTGARANIDLSAVNDTRCNNFVEFTVLDGPKYVEQVTLRDSNCNASIVVAYFDEQGGELASYQNRDFNPSKFSLAQSRDETVSPHTLLMSEVVSPSGETLFIYKWYVIDGALYSSQETVKLQQVINKLLSKPYQGEIWLFATKEQNADTRVMLQNMVEYSLGKH